MNKQILKYTTAVALLLDSSAATQSHLESGKRRIPQASFDTPMVVPEPGTGPFSRFPDDGIVDYPNGHSGPYPCRVKHYETRDYKNS